MKDEKERAHLDWLKELTNNTMKKVGKKREEFERLRGELEALERDSRSLERALDAAKSALGLPTSKQPQGRFREMSIKDAAEIILKERGDKMKVAEIWKALEEGGKELGERGYTLVFTTLKRSDRFEKVGKGIFRLKES